MASPADVSQEKERPGVHERDSLIKVGELARHFMAPLWLRLHEADRTWNLIRELPTVPSTALCRHTSLFVLRLFTSVGQTGWDVASGHVFRSAMRTVPGYVGDADIARHCWLEHPSVGWLDLASDQFGFPGIVLACPSDDDFRGYVKLPETAPLRNLKRTILNWEGRREGSWSPADLAFQARAYHRLREDAKRAFARGGNSSPEPSRLLNGKCRG